MSRRQPLAGGWSLWLLGGFLLGFGIVSLPSIGLLLLPVGVLVLLAAAVLARTRWMPAALLGAALPFFWVAWLHRGGPGERCWRTEHAGGCSELLDPVPFLLVGLALLGLGVLLLVAIRRSRRRAAGQRGRP